MQTFYDILAARYDLLQSDMDCEEWATFLSSLIDKYCHTSSEDRGIIDLGCGTGSVDIPLASMGYDVTGVDNAEAMLEVASSKEGSELVTWVLHDITDLQMDYKTDIFISVLDTLDHILDEDVLQGIFCNVSEHLLPGGVFVFDVITLKHLEETFADNIFYQDYDEFLLLWVNEYDPEEQVNRACLTFFEEDGKGKYDRYDGELVERYYPEEQLKAMGEKAGLTFQETVSRDEERFFMVFSKEE